MKFDTEKLDQAINEIVQKISAVVPDDLVNAKQSLEKNARVAIESVFQRMDLVTREEFDVQVNMLQKSQQQVKELEQRINELEQKFLN